VKFHNFLYNLYTKILLQNKFLLYYTHFEIHQDSSEHSLFVSSGSNENQKVFFSVSPMVHQVKKNTLASYFEARTVLYKSIHLAYCVQLARVFWKPSKRMQIHVQYYLHSNTIHAQKYDRFCTRHKIWKDHVCPLVHRIYHTYVNGC